MPKSKNFEEQDGWASAFIRPENTGKQPRFTGQGLDPDGNEIEVAAWVRRSRSGVQYLRIKIQPPYESEDDDEELLDDDELDERGDPGERDEQDEPPRRRRAPVEQEEPRRKRRRRRATPEEDEDGTPF